MKHGVGVVKLMKVAACVDIRVDIELLQLRREPPDAATPVLPLFSEKCPKPAADILGNHLPPQPGNASACAPEHQLHFARRWQPGKIDVSVDQKTIRGRKGSSQQPIWIWHPPKRQSLWNSHFLSRRELIVE